MIVKILQRKSHRGQGILIGVAAILLASLVLMGTGIHEMGWMHTKATVDNKTNLQLYYVAQAGLQEALATRMVPRSNYLAVNTVAGASSPYPLSGSVYQNPETLTNRLGLYRYIVLGGDPAVTSGTGVFNSSLFQKNLPQQPFYIISEGSVCRSNTNQSIAVNQISPNTAAEGAPQCATGFSLDQITLLSTVDLSRSVNATKDVLNTYRTFKTNTALPIPTPVFAPNYSGLVSTVNFNTIWSTGTAGNNADKSLKPVRVVIGTPLTTTPNVVTIAGPGTTAGPSNISTKSILWVHFQGAVDTRTIKNAACNADPLQCPVRVKKSTGEYYGGSILQPNWPGTTQVVMFPPLAKGGNYTVEILPGLGDDKGNRLGPAVPNTPLYQVSFTVKP
jgi:hypothetical protein